MEYLHYKEMAASTKALLPIACGAPAATFGLLRGVSAGWIGRMPDIGWGWVWPALGRCRGAMEVSMVGTGSVSLTRERRVNSLKVLGWQPKLFPSLTNLALVWLFLATASLALIGSGSFVGIVEFCKWYQTQVFYDNWTSVFIQSINRMITKWTHQHLKNGR